MKEFYSLLERRVKDPSETIWVVSEEGRKTSSPLQRRRAVSEERECSGKNVIRPST